MNEIKIKQYLFKDEKDYNLMNLYAKEGDKIRYIHTSNGLAYHQEIANKHLKVNGIYTVDYTEVGSSYSEVFIKEIPNVAFNTALFEDLKIEPVNMNKIKRISKGFTIEVESYENVYDNYEVNSIVVDTIEEAKQWFDVLQYCKQSSSKTEVLLGNTEVLNDKQKDLLKEIIFDYPLVFDDTLAKGVSDEYLLNLTLIKIKKLMGRSNEYQTRAMESCVVTYSSEDVYCDEVLSTEMS